MLDIQTTIKQSIFKPLYLNFPILDKYPILFASRKRAFILVKQFEDLLCNLIENRPRLRAGEKHNPDDDQLIHMLEQARKEGRMSEAQYRANLKITFIVAHENTQLLLTSMFYEIGKNKVRPPCYPTSNEDFPFTNHYHRRSRPNSAPKSSLHASQTPPPQRSTASPI